MQIHELNTLGSIPGNTDFLAIDTGFDTAKISADKLLEPKLNRPIDEHNQYDDGADGQLLRSKGDGSTEWSDVGQPTDAQTAQAVSDWLDAHPEATTTVADGSLTETKFSAALQLQTIKDYVTPQMFGAAADGVTDDTTAINDCIAHAVANDKLIYFPTATYAVESSISINESVIIDFGNSTIKYTGAAYINDLICYGFITSAPYKTHNGLYNLNIDGNANVKNGLHVTGGKGIRLSNINIIKAREYGLLIDKSLNDTWEMIAEKITSNVTIDANTQGLSAIKIENITDSFFSDIFAVNGSDSWIYSSANGTTFINVHGYSYPDTFSPLAGLVVSGSAQKFINTIIDTFNAVGIQVNAPINTFINTLFAKPAANTCIGFEDLTSYTVIDGVNCSDPITLIKSSTGDALSVKNITTYGTMVKDIELTRNALPYFFVYDNSGRATTKIKTSIASWEIVDTSAFQLTGCTLTSNPFVKKCGEVLRLAFGITCSAASVQIKTNIALPASQIVIAYNRTQGAPCMFSMWADGSLHNTDTVAIGDIIYFDSAVAYNY